MKTSLLVIIVGIIIASSVIFVAIWYSIPEECDEECEIERRRIGSGNSAYGTFDDEYKVLQKTLEDCRKNVGTLDDGYSLWSNQTHIITAGHCEIRERNNSSISVDVTKYDPKPYTQSIITIQDRLPDRKIVPITTTQLTLNAESLDTITEYNFSILNITMRTLGDYWGNLPDQYTTYEMVDQHGNDILNYDKLPMGFVTYPLSLERYPATCSDGKKITGESGYPTPIPIIDGASDVYFKKGSIGIYPDDDGKYSFEFVSGYETSVYHPHNVIIESHQTQKCILEKDKHGFDEVYYTTVIFSFKGLENEN